MSTGTAWPHPAPAPDRLAMLHDRWPTGTRAAAGTIPVRPVNTSVILVRSQGHHPANRRPAIPTRVYESGSGRGHQPAPVGHPHPARSPPAGFVLIIVGWREATGPPPGQDIRAGRGLPTDPHHPTMISTNPASLAGTRTRTTGRVHSPPSPRSPHNTKKNRQNDRNQARGAARVDEPLRMRSESWPRTLPRV